MIIVTAEIGLVPSKIGKKRAYITDIIPGRTASYGRDCLHGQNANNGDVWEIVRPAPGSRPARRRSGTKAWSERQKVAIRWKQRTSGRKATTNAAETSVVVKATPHYGEGNCRDQRDARWRTVV